MTEDVKDAPVVDATEQQEPPAPAMPSEGSPEESSAQPQDVGAIVEAQVKAAISSLDATLDDKVDARFKSAKDKRYAKVEEIYDWVKEAGGDVSKIKTSLELADLREQLDAVQSGPSEDAGTSPPLDSGWSLAQAETDIALQGAGIAANDPEYNVFMEQYRGKVSPKDWPPLVKTWIKGKKAGSPGAVVAEAGATALVSADQESISERLVAATLSGEPTEKIDELRIQLQEAMKS